MYVDYITYMGVYVYTTLYIELHYIEHSKHRTHALNSVCT